MQTKCDYRTGSNCTHLSLLHYRAPFIFTGSLRANFFLLREINIQVRLYLEVVLKSSDVDILIIRTSFYKSNIAGLNSHQQKRCKNWKMIFHDFTKNNGFQNIKITLKSINWMTMECSVVIFQALEYLWPQWPQQPQWPQWPQQPHFTKQIT